MSVYNDVGGGGAIPVGHIAPSSAINGPAGHFRCNGAAPSRASYSALFNEMSIQQTASQVLGSPILTALSDTSKMGIGMPVSGLGIPAGAKILSVDLGTQITLDVNATSTLILNPLVVAPFGVGDGTITFNVPDFRGEALRGLDDGAGIDVGRVFGSWQADELKSHAHKITRSGGYAGGVYTNVVTTNNLDNKSTAFFGGTETRSRNLATPFWIKF